MRLKDKVAIITGAARGLGAAFAIGFGKEGAKVVIGDIRDGKKTVDAIEKAGGEALYVKMDVTKQDQCNAMAKAAVDHFGAIDILINNAGTLVTIKPFWEVTTEEWMEVMATNTLGPFHCTKAVLRGMLRARWGRIISVASVAGMAGNAGQANYAAAKAGLIGLTRSLAREVASRNVTVNAVAPGFVETDMTAGLSHAWRERAIDLIPIGRFGLPQEVAATVAFLASDEAAYITGQVVSVDGGLGMR